MFALWEASEHAEMEKHENLTLFCCQRQQAPDEGITGIYICRRKLTGISAALGTARFILLKVEVGKSPRKKS